MRHACVSSQVKDTGTHYVHDGDDELARAAHVGGRARSRVASDAFERLDGRIDRHGGSGGITVQNG